ncbi:unnamed protein product [Paramecium pentaurelia]|uniref:Uncharacterized protein n=1 Tax=Paramecium pentaurelia TaxID=43138 RepID=A0A8S1TT10_9CILI|nr:unnamed protein product [Paramecium pentaurelia]
MIKYWFFLFFNNLILINQRNEANNLELTVYWNLSIHKSFKCVRDFKCRNEMNNEHLNEHDQLIFHNWMFEYGKSYDNDFTVTHGMQIFMRNKKNIEKHNHIGVKYKAKLNEFSDQDYDELALKMFMHLDFNDDDLKFCNHHFFSKQDIKELRNHPILNQIREQAKKGDSLDWSYTIQTIRNMWKLERKTQLNYQRLILIDCCVGDKNNGCNGRSPIGAYKFINENGALKKNEYREYDATQQDCQKSGGNISKGQIVDVEKVNDPTVEQIKEALQDGPVTALMYADKSWFEYGGGIIDTCSYVGAIELSHAVVIVGYGKDHYQFKNSWGSGWGENGLFQVQRNGAPECLDKIKKISYQIIQ